MCLLPTVTLRLGNSYKAILVPATYQLLDNQLLIRNRAKRCGASAPVFVNKVDEIDWEYQVFDEQYGVTI